MPCNTMKQLALRALTELEARILHCKSMQYRPNDNPLRQHWTQARVIAFWNMEMFKAVYQYEKISARFEVSK